jgi:hypothetical protein
MNWLELIGARLGDADFLRDAVSDVEEVHVVQKREDIFLSFLKGQTLNDWQRNLD